MRILIATHSIDRSGSARSLRILVRHLAARHELSVVSLLPPRPDRPMAEEYAALGVPVRLFEWGRLPISYKGVAVPEREQDARCEVMRPRIPEFRAWAGEADLLLFNGYPALSLAALAPDIPKVLIAGEVVEESSPRFDSVARFIRRHVTRAVAIGSREAELPERLGIPCRIIFNSAERAPRFLDFPPLAPVRFGYFGQLAASGGLMDLIRAAATVAPALRRAHAAVHICGGNAANPSPLQRRMQGTIDRNGLGDIIFLHDWTDNVEEAVRPVHCIVCPDPAGSPWGRDIIEAMSMGRPVIAAGTEEVFIRPGKTGWLVRPGDPAHLAATLSVLSRSGMELEKMGRNAFEFAREHFDPAKTLPELEAAILDEKQDSVPIHAPARERTATLVFSPPAHGSLRNPGGSHNRPARPRD